MTYTLVNLPFLAVTAVLAVVLVLRTGRRFVPAVLGAVAGLLVLTAVFDNVIIGLGIVDYDPATTSGLRLGLAPVEDFAYAIAAGVALPALWCLLPGRRASAREDS